MGAFQHTFAPDPLTLPSFLAVADADTLAAALPALDAFKAASQEAKGQYLIAASDRVANSRPWQGSKCDAMQVLPFPRYRNRPAGYWLGRGVPADEVWDLDPVTQTPVVPLDVRKATLYEADSLASGDRQRTQEAIQSGIASMVTGSLQVAYSTDAKGIPLLCLAADVLLKKYLRRTAVLT